MENNNLKQTQKAAFITPKAEIIVFDKNDVIQTSGGGFYSQWDEDDIPPENDVLLPKIGF